MTASTEISFDKIFAFEVTDEIIHRNDFINNVIQKLDATHVNRLILDQGLNLSNQQISELSWELDQRSVEMLVVPEFLGIWASRLQLVRHASLPLIELLEPRLSPVQQTQKRVLDLVITIPVFILLQPLYLFITLLVAMSSPGPVLFIQERVGTDGKAFKFYKFRTMRNGAELERQEILGLPDDEITERYKHDPRVTSVGRILRRFSIDELPQLWNVIRGDMSLVGPRPMLFDEIALLDENQQRRHLTKPGLTGLWQISGRKETSWEERILLDLYYIDQWSISSDLAIMLKTLKVVADGKGSY
jgi:exopolysaccharide biosynthesis polyprenyl glycosylphosphotransferase